jgi:serine/threonine protein kinase
MKASNNHIANRVELRSGSSVEGVRGRYSIDKKLGDGTFGIVFKAKGSDGTVYALKLLRLWEVASELRAELMARFDMEFRTGQISSRYLVQSYDKGVIKGNPFIVMEYCPGGDLLQLARAGSIDIVKAARETLYGLGALHACGKVHRDLKPENVLVKSDGSFALTDFGISGDRNKRMTEMGIFGKPKQIFGTYAYMPPEQVRPKNGNATVLPTTDIFSFGVMMYQLIVGKLPFGKLETENDLAQYINRGKSGEWDRSLLRRTVRHEFFVPLIEGCLAPNYKDRIQSVEEALRFLPAEVTRREKQQQGSEITQMNESPMNETQITSFQKEITKGMLLRVMQGEDHGKVFLLNDLIRGRKKTITIGREDVDSKNDVSLTEEQSAYISRRHSTLEWRSDDRVWFLRDGQKTDSGTDSDWRASTNGTFVNSHEVSQTGMYVYPGDVITVGDVKLRAEGY